MVMALQLLRANKKALDLGVLRQKHSLILASTLLQLQLSYQSRGMKKKITSSLLHNQPSLILIISIIPYGTSSIVEFPPSNGSLKILFCNDIINVKSATTSTTVLLK